MDDKLHRRAPSATEVAEPDRRLHVSTALMFFNDLEAITVEAVAARIIPGETDSPGARDARVVVYIDRALAGYSTELQQLYRVGIRALDERCCTRYGAPFRLLGEAQQDEVLTGIDGSAVPAHETDTTSGTVGDPLVRFFSVIREHTIEGMFCDPVYGGNYDAVGWKLIGFPGAQWGYSAEQMRPGFDAATIPIASLADLRARPVPPAPPDAKSRSDR
jgi:gluconate 2-dehydrogenase gamma chain